MFTLHHSGRQSLFSVRAELTIQRLTNFLGHINALLAGKPIAGVGQPIPIAFMPFRIGCWDIQRSVGICSFLQLHLQYVSPSSPRSHRVSVALHPPRKRPEPSRPASDVPAKLRDRHSRCAPHEPARQTPAPRDQQYAQVERSCPAWLE